MCSRYSRSDGPSLARGGWCECGVLFVSYGCAGSGAMRRCREPWTLAGDAGRLKDVGGVGDLWPVSPV